MRKALERGINMTKIEALVRKTFFHDPGIPRDVNAIFEAYDRGDPDVTAWVNMRKEIINGFAKEIVNTIRASGKPVSISTALEPQGAYDSNWFVSQADSRTFAHVHYAQDYAVMAMLFDYVTPMLYSREFGQSPQWVSVLHKNTVDIFGTNRVATGLQAYRPGTSAELAEGVKYVRAHQEPGIVLFRYATSGLSRVDVSEDRDVMGIDLTNSLPVNLTKIEITVTGGFELKGILNTKNLENAQIEVAADGQTIVIRGTPLMIQNAVASIYLEVDGTYNPAVAPVQIRFYDRGLPGMPTRREWPVYVYVRGEYEDTVDEE
jgi:hypothetical protein